ncbi:MAG TPA: hypothetical protein PKI32_05500, partial [Opitutales bacterium]|nr:hypothetical protein [Opitutales bacterium]
VHRDIAVTRIPIPKHSDASQLLAQFRYVTGAPYSEYIPEAIAVLRRVLSGYDRPVLLTRAYPAISNIVGYETRRYASRWVAHFSDPFPGMGVYSGRTAYKALADKWWALRIFSRADLVTVTCRNAVRHFCHSLGRDYASKMHVAYHVGQPPLTPVPVGVQWGEGLFNMAHVGYWSRSRYMPEIVSELSAASREWDALRMIQFGAIEKRTSDEWRNAMPSWLRLEEGRLTSPGSASAVLSHADMNVAIDQNDGLSFCPYLSSKFVYAISSGRPVLGIGQADCEMAMLAREHPSFYFADARKPGELRNLLLSIRDKPASEIRCPDESLRDLFSPRSVASQFLTRLECSL